MFFPGYCGLLLSICCSGKCDEEDKCDKSLVMSGKVKMTKIKNGIYYKDNWETKMKYAREYYHKNREKILLQRKKKYKEMKEGKGKNGNIAQ
jgi:hypothetical protein